MYEENSEFKIQNSKFSQKTPIFRGEGPFGLHFGVLHCRNNTFLHTLMKHSSAHPTAASCRILLGCSEEPLLRIVRHTLEPLGVRVDGASSHQALLVRTRRHRYRLIMTRFVAPLISSPSDIGRLRQGAHHPPLFVLSHTHSRQIVVTLLEGGVSQFLSLPVSLGRLRGKVEAEIGKYCDKED